jgi:hypothetical protein
MPQQHDDTIEILAQERRERLPPTIHQVQRRVFGVEPLPLLFGATALALVLALALLVAGDPIPAIVLLVITVVLGAFVRTGIRRDPESRLARGWRAAADRFGSRARVVAVAIRAWSTAAAQLVLVRAGRLRLRRQLREQLTPLGEAVYRDQPERVQAIKASAGALERELLESQRKDAVLVGAARDAIDRERALAGPTEALPRQSERR